MSWRWMSLALCFLSYYAGFMPTTYALDPAFYLLIEYRIDPSMVDLLKYYITLNVDILVNGFFNILTILFN